MINIGIIESPFQFWMAKEYQNYSESSLDFKIIVRGLIPDHKSLYHDNFLNSDSFNYYQSQNRLLTLLNIFKITFLYRNKVQKLVIPFYFSFFYKICIYAINPVEIIYVDDGTHTIEASKDYDNFLYRKYNCKFFTIFKNCPFKKEHLIQNNLEYAKSLLLRPYKAENNRGENVWIGNSLVPDYLTRSRYIDCMRDSGVDYKGYDWTYFASRTETDEDIKLIKEAFPEIKILKPNASLEIHLIKNDIQIQQLRGFMSTCFFTIKILFENRDIDYEIIYPDEFYESGISDRDYKDANKRQRLFYEYAKQSNYRIKSSNS